MSESGSRWEQYTPPTSETDHVSWHTPLYTTPAVNKQAVT